MSKQKTKEAEAQIPDSPDVVIVKAAKAAKLSPRGEGGIAYQVGRIGEEILVRISENFGGGRHSKEWVPVMNIRSAMSRTMLSGMPFKSTAMVAAFKGRSQNNSGFLVAALRAEGLFAEDAEHKGMSRITGDLDAWERAMREAAPVLKDDGQPETAKLHPEPRETKFRPKQAVASSDDEPRAEGTNLPSDVPPQDAAPQGGDAKPKRQIVRIRKKLADEMGLRGEAKTAPADGSESTEPGGGADSAVA